MANRLELGSREAIRCAGAPTSGCGLAASRACSSATIAPAQARYMLIEGARVNGWPRRSARSLSRLLAEGLLAQRAR